ncbi:hypothetical protein CRE_05442 [Caenorhabditis remanei]|uniref:Uncharacterized protein n=1 Tax=Caenorhabditis remanei TaxID=31234 RepID=E3M0J4_CAERE|nr:hypothetical protein CRE_05442 [Caenorhabditis remanei]
MILCNFVQLSMEVIQDVVPVFLSKEGYNFVRHNYGKYITFIHDIRITNIFNSFDGYRKILFNIFPGRTGMLK